MMPEEHRAMSGHAHPPDEAGRVVPIEVTTEDGIALRGELRPGAEDWVLLIHDQGEDLDAWADLPALLAARGFSVVAMDLRGHGVSDGEADPKTMVSDLMAVIDFAVRSGADRLYLGSAGEAAAAMLPIVRNPAVATAGLFLLSPVMSMAGPPPTVPKLLLVGRGEAMSGDESPVAIGPWTIVRLPVQQRGLDLLRGAWGIHVREYILRFLADLRRGAPVAMRPRRAGPSQEVKP